MYMFIVYCITAVVSYVCVTVQRVIINHVRQDVISCWIVVISAKENVQAGK